MSAGLPRMCAFRRSSLYFPRKQSPLAPPLRSKASTRLAAAAAKDARAARRRGQDDADVGLDGERRGPLDVPGGPWPTPEEVTAAAKAHCDAEDLP